MTSVAYENSGRENRIVSKEQNNPKPPPPVSAWTTPRIPCFSLLQLQKFPEAPLAAQRRGWKGLPKDGASSESLAGANWEATGEAGSVTWAGVARSHPSGLFSLLEKNQPMIGSLLQIYPKKSAQWG